MKPIEKEAEYFARMEFDKKKKTKKEKHQKMAPDSRGRNSAAADPSVAQRYFPQR